MTSLGNLFQCLNTIILREFFFLCRSGISNISVCVQMQSFLRVRKYSEFVLVSLTVDKIASWLNFSLCTYAWIIHASHNKTNNFTFFSDILFF